MRDDYENRNLVFLNRRRKEAMRPGRTHPNTKNNSTPTNLPEPKQDSTQARRDSMGWLFCGAEKKIIPVAVGVVALARPVMLPT